mgnify:CR=1 FL=1
MQRGRRLFYTDNYFKTWYVAALLSPVYSPLPALQTDSGSNRPEGQKHLILPSLFLGYRLDRISRLFSFQRINFRGRCSLHEPHLPLCRAICFPIAPFGQRVDCQTVTSMDIPSMEMEDRSIPPAALPDAVGDPDKTLPAPMMPDKVSLMASLPSSASSFMA